MVPGFRKSLMLLALLAQSALADKQAADKLFSAISKGDGVGVEALLAADPQLVRATEESGGSVVMAALFQIRQEGFVPPLKNGILRTVLSRKPPLTFLEACGVGDTGEVARQLRRDATLATAWSDFGWSALHLAAFSGVREAALLLIEQGADVNARARTSFRNTPLQVALLPGQLETASLLLERGADPLARQSHGFSSLMEAALLGRRDLVDLLLQHGAEMNSRADDGRNAVTEALRGGHRELAAYLKSRGGQGAELTADLAKPPQ
jgi:ankyrin repeat protein